MSNAHHHVESAGFSTSFVLVLFILLIIISCTLCNF